MKEKELKQLFISSIRAGHVKTICNENNDDSIKIHDNSASFFPSAANSHTDIRIKDEGCFRNFDLVIAVIDKINNNNNNNNANHNIVYDSIESYDKYFNILMRSGILTQFAKAEKCRIDSIRFYPVELKSDDDVLDERLPNQVLNAILTFGRSMIVLDKKHSRRAIQRKMASLIPATIIGYSGEDDYFEVLSIFDKFVTNNVFSIKKRRLARILLQNGISDKIDRVYQCLTNIQALNQKLAFSELYNDDNVTFLKHEIDFLRNLTNLHLYSEKKQIANLIRETKNNKITDYI
jgi:hypothetical protein